DRSPLSLHDALPILSLGAISETATHMSLHTAAPDASGSNESTANREPIELVLDNDELTVSNVSFTGGAANGPVTHVGFWTAATRSEEHTSELQSREK